MKYEHVVYLEEKEGYLHLCIAPLFDNGQRGFITHRKLGKTSGDIEGFELMCKVAEWLGNSLLIDSPQFRNYIRIDE